MYTLPGVLYVWVVFMSRVQHFFCIFILLNIFRLRIFETKPEKVNSQFLQFSSLGEMTFDLQGW